MTAPREEIFEQPVIVARVAVDPERFVATAAAVHGQYVATLRAGSSGVTWVDAMWSGTDWQAVGPHPDRHVWRKRLDRSRLPVVRA